MTVKENLIVDKYNEMIKSTTTANGKTAARKVTLIVAVVEVQSFISRKVIL